MTSRPLRTGSAALGLLIVLATDTMAAPTCVQEIGPRQAGELARQCREVSLARRPPCAATLACALLREEIARGCAERGADAPSFCQLHSTPDEDDDEDEDASG